MYIFANGDRYQGAWKDGKKHGPGIFLYLADNEFKGDIYVGEYKFDIYNGQGTYIWKDGSKYTGNWLDNNQDGQGIYIYPDGSKEVGEFKNGLLNGFAIRYNADGSIRREGIFKDYEFLYAETREKKDPSSQMSSLSPCPSDQNATYDMCFGTYDWTSGDNKGDRYKGEWKKNIMHGHGMYILSLIHI